MERQGTGGGGRRASEGAAAGAAAASQEQERRRSSMDPVRDMTPLEEYQTHYDPVVTDRLIGQRVVKQRKVDTNRLGLKLDKLSRQQSLTDRQAEKERRAVQKELDALQLESTGHHGPLPRHYLSKDLTSILPPPHGQGLRGGDEGAGAGAGLKWPIQGLPPRHPPPETNYGRVRRSKSLR